MDILRRFGGGGVRRVLLAAASLAAASLPAARAALADDLPGQLVVASKLIPDTEQGRERCSMIDGLENRLRMPFTLGDHRTFTDGTAGYTRNAKDDTRTACRRPSSSWNTSVEPRRSHDPARIICSMGELRSVERTYTELYSPA